MKKFFWIIVLIIATSILPQSVVAQEKQKCTSDQKAIARMLSESFRDALKTSNGRTLKDIYIKAFTIISDRRNRPSNSTNSNLRNAQYYFMGVVAAHKGVIDTAVVSGTPVYELGKNFTVLLKELGFPQLEYELRSNKSNPVSKGFGSNWLYKGINHGFETRESKGKNYARDEKKLKLSAKCLPNKKISLTVGNLEVELTTTDSNSPSDIDVLVIEPTLDRTGTVTVKDLPRRSNGRSGGGGDDDEAKASIIESSTEDEKPE